MQKYLYSFGYASPALEASNTRLGTDFADSEAFLIMADDKAVAQNWGEQLADKFLQILYGDPSVTLVNLQYHGRIEDDYEKEWTENQLAKLPMVRVGEVFDWKAILKKKYGSDWEHIEGKLAPSIKS